MKPYPINHINVEIVFDENPIPVGRLALHNKRIYFEFDYEFIGLGLNISPLKCPLVHGIKTFDQHLFEGLPGVFNDSLPDGWGRLLLDRHMRKNGILPESLTPLDRLTNVGQWGMGALAYKPDYSEKDSGDVLDLDAIAMHSEQVLSGESTEILEELIRLNGSSTGARPKAMICVDRSKQQITHGTQNLSEGFESWLVKFPTMNDGRDAGSIEYIYALMAIDAGIEMQEIHLFQTKKQSHYFATKRFDRNKSKRFHVHTVCGLLHSDFRTPSLDYEDLMTLAMHITKDIRETERMYQLAVFNVLAHNRDDHSKNFSFIMDDKGKWSLSPAYDITFSSGPGGEQSTTVLGEGKQPSISHLIALGKRSDLSVSFIVNTIEKTKKALSQWPSLAKEYSISKEMIDLISSKIKKVQQG